MHKYAKPGPMFFPWSYNENGPFVTINIHKFLWLLFFKKRTILDSDFFDKFVTRLQKSAYKTTVEL